MATASRPEMLDDEFVAHQRALLQQQRQERTDVVNALEAEIRNHLRARETGGVPVEAFGTGETASSELERARDRYSRAMARLAEMDAAFARLDQGTYGICERCGQLIGRDRLDAIPTARRCIICQTRR